MKYTKTEINKFAKQLSMATNLYLDAIGVMEDISNSIIIKDIDNGDKELIIAIFEKYKKYSGIDNFIQNPLVHGATIEDFGGLLYEMNKYID